MNKLILDAIDFFLFVVISWGGIWILVGVHNWLMNRRKKKYKDKNINL
jgi:hypothetical protein